MTYRDPNHDGNSSRYHTGKQCIEEQCDKPAGTRWSPFWCAQCNAERLDRISASLNGMVNKMAQRLRDDEQSG